MIISNSSPLISLSKIDRLDIFKSLFHIIYIPKSVFNETVTENKHKFDREIIKQAVEDFIEIVKSTTDYPFNRVLHKGKKQFSI